MNARQAVITCFKKYIVFSGRANRPEFWYFILFLFAGSLVLVIVNSAIFGPDVTYRYRLDENGEPVGNPIAVNKRYNGGWFGTGFFVVCLLPWLAVTWRRMHDVGKPGYLPFVTLVFWAAAVISITIVYSGANQFLSQMQETGRVSVNVPTPLGMAVIVAFLLVLIRNIAWLANKSDPGPNTYGPNPNEVLQ